MKLQPKVLTVGPEITGTDGLAALMRAYRDSFGCLKLLPYNSRHGRFAAAAGRIAHAIRLPLLRLAGYNILHAHASNADTLRLSARLLRAGRRAGFRTILHWHGMDYQNIFTRAPQWIRHETQRADAVIVLSEAWLPFFRDCLSCRRVTAIPNLVPDIRITRNRSFRRPDEPLRMLYIGKFERRKGLFDLIRAIRPLAQKYESYLQLTIAGAGEINPVIDLVDELNLNSTIRFEGNVEFKEKDRLYRLNDVLVHPSHTDGMPVDILEAGVYNMPCIATRVGAIPDVIQHGVNGYLVDPGQPEQLTEAIRYYLTNPQAIPEQGERARRLIEPYLPTSVATRFSQLYHQLLDRP